MASALAQQIARTLQNAGLSRAGAAGVLGNLQQESSINPNAPGGGLAQWIGSRGTALQRFAASQSRPVNDPGVQTSFLLNELRTQYPGLYGSLRTATDPRAAALAFSQQFERPGVPMNQNRESYAASLYGQLGGAASSRVSPTAATGLPAAGGPTFATSGPTTQFDQAAFDKAQRAAIAGQYLAGQAGSSMWQTGPKSTINVGSLIGPGLLSTVKPNEADYTTTTPAHTVAQTSLQQLAGPTNLNVHPGSLPPGAGDVNPLAHGWKIGRTDQGVDANAAPGTPILAVNDSVVKEIVPNWYSGQPLVLLQLTSGPNRGRYVYVAEQITQLPKVGQRIARGQVVARYAGSGTGIEIGWGDPRSSGRTLAQATPGYSGDTSAASLAAGSSFRRGILHA